MKIVKTGAPPNALNTHVTTKPDSIQTKNRLIDRLLRMPDVERLTGCGKSSIYALMAAGKFPKNIRITRRLSCWKESDIQNWIAEQSAEKSAA